MVVQVKTRDGHRAETNQLWMILLCGVTEQLLTPPAFLEPA